MLEYALCNGENTIIVELSGYSITVINTVGNFAQWIMTPRGYTDSKCDHMYPT